MRAALIALLLSACKTASSDPPDLSQPATCVVFLPSGIDRPACRLLAGDLLGGSDGHLVITLESDAFVTFDRPMELRVRGALAPTSLTLPQLQPASFGELAVKGDQSYIVAPVYQGALWGAAQVTLTDVEPLAASQEGTVVSLVQGALDLWLAGVDNHKVTVPLRVTF